MATSPSYLPRPDMWLVEYTFAELDIKLDFKQVEFEKPMGFPFSIPKNFKVIN